MCVKVRQRKHIQSRACLVYQCAHIAWNKRNTQVHTHLRDIQLAKKDTHPTSDILILSLCTRPTVLTSGRAQDAHRHAVVHLSDCRLSSISWCPPQFVVVDKHTDGWRHADPNGYGHHTRMFSNHTIVFSPLLTFDRLSSLRRLCYELEQKVRS